MKMKEIKGKNAGELQKMVAEKRASLHAIRFGTAGSKSKNVKEVSSIRKDIARMMTAITETKKQA